MDGKRILDDVLAPLATSLQKAALASLSRACRWPAKDRCTNAPLHEAEMDARLTQVAWSDDVAFVAASLDHISTISRELADLLQGNS